MRPHADARRRASPPDPALRRYLHDELAAGLLHRRDAVGLRSLRQPEQLGEVLHELEELLGVRDGRSLPGLRRLLKDLPAEFVDLGMLLDVVRGEIVPPEDAHLA